jgi:hypothetical protein
MFHPYSNWNVKRAARKDAMHEPPIPAPSSPDHPPFIRRLKQAADGTIRDLATQWKKREGKLKSKWHRAVKQLAYWSDILEKREKAFTEALERFRRHSGLDVEDLRWGRKWKYYVMAIALGLSEVAINEFVFRSLHESEAVTVLFALTIGGILVGVGHHLGVHARDRQYEGKPPLDLTFILWVGSALLLIAGLTWARWLYFKRTGGGADSANMSWALIMVFFAVNVLILMIASWTAHASYLPGESYLVKLRRQIGRIKPHIEHLEEKVKVLRTRAEHLREDFLRRAEGVKDAAQQLHYLYYEHDLRNRADTSDYPASYHTRLSVDATIEKSFPPMVWDEDLPQLGLAHEAGAGDQGLKGITKPSAIDSSKDQTANAGPASPALSKRGGEP